jgi:hypothetical protein
MLACLLLARAAVADEGIYRNEAVGATVRFPGTYSVLRMKDPATSSAMGEADRGVAFVHAHTGLAASDEALRGCAAEMLSAFPADGPWKPITVAGADAAFTIPIRQKVPGNPDILGEMRAVRRGGDTILWGVVGAPDSKMARGSAGARAFLDSMTLGPKSPPRPDAPRAYRDEENGFQLMVPAGWGGADDADAVLRAGSNETGEELRVIRMETGPPPKDAAQTLLATFEGKFKKQPGYHRLSSKKHVLDGHPALDLWFTVVDEEGTALRGLRCIALEQHTIAAFVGGGKLDSPVLRGVIDSFRPIAK